MKAVMGKIVDVEEILAQTLSSTEIYGRFFFPEIFFSPFSNLHREITTAIDVGHQRLAIAAPRGFGKTSIIVNGFMSKRILFNLSKYIVYITGSSDLAISQTENLKRELLANELVREVFGRIDANYDEEFKESFSKKSWVSSFGTKVLPRGAGQQVRGILHNFNGKNHRPDLIIFDDLEDKELIQSEEQRRKLREWFYSDPLKCVSAYDKDYIFIYIDTIKHEDSLLEMLLNDPSWHGIRLDICDDEFNTLDPTYMTSEEIRAEYEEHKRQGLEDVFFRERRSIPISTIDRAFKGGYFRYYDEMGDYLKIGDEKISEKEMVNVIIADPAKTSKLESADSAIVCVGVHRSSQKLFVRQVRSGKFTPSDFYDNLFEMVNWFRAPIFGVEVTGLEDFISQPIRNIMQMKGIISTFLELKARQGHAEKGKVLRIRELVPYYERGLIFHNKPQTQKLETQLLSFPRSKYWDVMDALAYINQIIDREEGRLLFEPMDFEPDPDESEFDELDNDPALSFAGICP